MNNLEIENENYDPLTFVNEQIDKTVNEYIDKEVDNCVNEHIDKISYKDLEKMCEKMYVESDEYLKMMERINNLDDRLNNLGKSSKTDDKYDDFRYGWALLGLALLLFVVYINWAAISAAAIYAASFLQTMSWTTQFGIAFTVSSCLTAGIITFITMKKEEMLVKGPSSIASTELQANTNVSPIKKILSTDNDGLEDLTIKGRVQAGDIS